ncbi:hypothetical protein ABBQ32_002912 [Trebouxia sp. C0010 RCD-2024]
MLQQSVGKSHANVAAGSLTSLRARTEALQRIRHAGMQCRMGHRKVLHRCTGAKRQPDEAASSQRSPMSSDEATSSGGGIPDAQTDQEPGTGASGSSPLIPQLYLFGSALLWGTSAPAMRYLFLQGQGQAPTPSVIAAVQTTAAALCLALLELGSKQLQQSSNSAPSTSGADTHTQGQRGFATDGATPAVDPSSSAWPINIFLTATASSVTFAGFELGLWAFIANCSTITGFENTSTSRGTFLLRLSAMFTPIVASLVGERFPRPVWLGCFAAFTGGVLISSDSSSSSAGSGAFLSLTSGDLFILFAALMWSVQTVSVGRHAPNFAPITLAKFQLATMSLFSASWLAYNAAMTAQSGLPLTHLWGGYDHAFNWFVLLIPALGPWGIGTALQAKGQAQVSSAGAMIILASDPIWATLFAGLVGGTEQHLGPLGWLGAVSILSASVIASGGQQQRQT